jgi:16S rRNA (guanine966-N2)-methyltransferase
MRVIAGENGGRRLVAPPGRGTRPTSDRVREAVFSMLESSMAESSVKESSVNESSLTGRRNGLEGATVWDLFAGSGAMGIEALSRGAAHATFVDQAGPAVSAVRANLAALGYGPERASVVCSDVLRWSGALPVPVAGGYPEPPESAQLPERPDPSEGSGHTPRPVPRERAAPSKGAKADLVMADPPYAWQGWAELLACLAPLRPLVLAETGTELALPPGWQSLRAKRYGGTVVTLARFSEGS